MKHYRWREAVRLPPLNFRVVTCNTVLLPQITNNQKMKIWRKPQTSLVLRPPQQILLRNSHTKTTTIDEHLHPKIKSHPWTEWPKFITNLKLKGYFDRPSSEQLLRAELIHDDFRLCPKFFHQAASASLFFAHEHPHLIDSLSRKDIVDVYRFGIPDLFRDHNTAKRMKFFVQGVQNNEVKDVEFVSKGLSPPQIIIHSAWILNNYKAEMSGILQELDSEDLLYSSVFRVIRNVLEDALYAASKEREGKEVTDKEKARISSNYQSALKELANVLGEGGKAQEVGRAQTVDLMRYILKEVYMPNFSCSPGRCGPAPYRNLLRELVNETRVVQDGWFTPLPYRPSGETSK